MPNNRGRGGGGGGGGGTTNSLEGIIAAGPRRGQGFRARRKRLWVGSLETAAGRAVGVWDGPTAAARHAEYTPPGERGVRDWAAQRPPELPDVQSFLTRRSAAAADQELARGPAAAPPGPAFVPVVSMNIQYTQAFLKKSVAVWNQPDEDFRRTVAAAATSAAPNTEPVR